MSGDLDPDVTLLIAAARRGDARASERLFELVYDELRRIARRSRYVGRDGSTMQPTALANEAFLVLNRRLPPPPPDRHEDRATFYLTVARAMRTILRDHWRKHNTQKRGGPRSAIALGDHDPADPRAAEDLGPVDYLALDDAIDRLEAYNQRWHENVMHRFFAGRTLDETARLMDLSATTVKSDWKLARAWLRRELETSPDERD